MRWLFGVSEYERQLQITARQQAETDRQLELSKAMQEKRRMQEEAQQEDYNRRLEESNREQERQNHEHAAYMERVMAEHERYVKLLDLWEEQGRRCNAILERWERLSPPR